MATIERGQLIAYVPEPDEARWLQNRRAIGAGWLLLKRVAALPGDEVCRRETTVFLNEVPIAQALERDAIGRELPANAGCNVLGPSDVFLLADHPRSLDGRYFGPQSRNRILGHAKFLWQPPAWLAVQE